MKGAVDFLEPFVGDVGIDLRGGDGGVAEHRLNRPDIGAVDEEIGRETVAERVGMDIFADAGFFGIVFHQPLDASWREPPALALGIFGISQARFSVGDKEGGIDIGAFIEIVF